MRKIYQNFILTFCLAAILSGCGSGLCPLRSPVSVCKISPGGSSWLGAIGTLDTSFNGTGFATTPMGISMDYGLSVALQPDGNIVAGGYSLTAGNKDFALARYTSSGALDTSFNTTGKLVTPIGANDDVINGVAIQTDGKIVTAGYSQNGGFISDFAIVRFNSNGSFDTSFNATGIVTTHIGASGQQANAVVLQPDGKIVAVGQYNNGSDWDVAIARYNTDGSLDTSFNTTGYSTSPVGASWDYFYAVALQPDGKIIAAGTTFNAFNDFLVMRYNSNGTLDNSFNGTGIVTTDMGGNEEIHGIALQPDGKIVVAGNKDAKFAVARYNSNGSLDTSFNGIGYVNTAIGSNDRAYAVNIQPDGKIITMGFAYNGSDWDLGLARYNSNGSLDTTFNNTGKIITPIGISDDWGYAGTMQSDGKIYVVGTTSNAGNYDWVIARYR